MIGGRRFSFSTAASGIVFLSAALGCGGRSSLTLGEVEPSGGRGLGGLPRGNSAGKAANGGRAPSNGGSAGAPSTATAGVGAKAGGSGGGGAGLAGAAGAPITLVCGLNIDDLETGTGRICEGVEGRRGVWYAFNDGTGTQWPAPTTPGTPIATSDIPGGRGPSRRAIHSYGGGFAVWGVGVGFDLAFDGTTYGAYDARAYDGITFWAKGEPDLNGDAPATLAFRVSTAGTTLTKYGGRCPDDNCARPLGMVVTLNREWTQYWVPFAALGSVEQSALTNVQFMPSGSFDIWVDDVSFFVGAPNCCPAACQNGFALPDSALAAAVERAIGQPGRALSCGSLCALYNLFAMGDSASAMGDIQALRGLECAPALVTLDLTGNQIRDLTPLASLSELRRLTLRDNRIEDVRPLAGLQVVGNLGLSNNLIRDTSQFTGLDSIRSLDLSYNQIEKLTLHGGLSRATFLELTHNPVTAVVAPFDLPSLERIDLSDCQVRDVSGLAGAPLLVNIWLANNQLTSLASFSGLASVTSIDLSNNHITGFADAPALPTLENLVLPNNGTSSLLGISQFPALTGLDLRDNQLTEIAPLAALSELSSLDVSNNATLEDLSPLRDLVKMSALIVKNANLRDLSALARLQGLASLDITNNHVVDISVLARFARLSTLNASHNEIQSLAGLSGLTITYYDLSYNRIQDLGSLTDIAYQAAFNPRGSAPPGWNLSHNQISDLSGLVTSTGLVPFMSIDLRDNPISCIAQADNIQKLRQRVSSVQLDCPTN